MSLVVVFKSTLRLWNKPFQAAVGYRLYSSYSGLKVLESSVNLDAKEWKEQTEVNLKLQRQWHERRERSYRGGGPKAIERHVVRNKKVLVRERIRMLLDEDYPFLEIAAGAGLDLSYGDVPGAGMVTGIGKISGQLCLVGGNDATVKGGSVYPIGVKKQLRMQEIAAENNLPCVYITDSAGGFLPLQSELFADSQHGGRTFYNEAVLSASGIPQICIVAGSSTAGGAYVPTMCDEAVIVHKIGSVYLGGPPLVQAATGEIVSSEDLGGAKVHCEESGSLDYFAATEDDAIQEVKYIMSTLNLTYCNKEHESYEEPRYDVLELNQLAGFHSTCNVGNMYDVIARILDGSKFHEFKPRFGKTLITGFGHLYGHLVGIVANNGILGYKSCLKGAHFTEICCQRKIPMMFFQNTETPKPASDIDIHVMNAKSKMMACVANAQVPKLTVIMGKSIGEDNITMCGRSMGPRFLYCWPGAEISMHDNTAQEELLSESGLSGYAGYDELKIGLDLWSNVKNQSEAFYLESRLSHDGVILPSDTRRTLGLSLIASLLHKPLSYSEKSVLRM